VTPRLALLDSDGVKRRASDVPRQELSLFDLFFNVSFFVFKYTDVQVKITHSAKALYIVCYSLVHIILQDYIILFSAIYRC